jgi:UDP-N-acetylglucosamine--N-acetylmuramyl-(pentapeptide) pyrophosphoryl-undecaprenol N-acetylglucosamine transferase
VMIAESELSAERLAAELLRLCDGRARLLAMADRARALARPHAAQELAEACVQLVRSAGVGGMA